MVLLFLLFWLMAVLILFLGKRKVSLPGLVVVILISMLMAFNAYNMDYDTYEEVYNSINDLSNLDHGNDFMYILVNRLGNWLGLSFGEFRCIYISSCLLSYYCFAVKHTKYVALCMVFYFLCGGLFDYIQLRQFGAMAIAIWLTDVAMNRNQNKSWLKATVILLFASGFHVLSLLYLIIFPYFFWPEKQKRIFRLSFVILIATIFVGLNSSVIYTLMSYFAGEGTASYYLISNNYIDTVAKIILDMVIQQVLLIVILYLRYRDCLKHNCDGYEVMAIWAVDILITALMPLNVLTIQFKRITRMTLIPSFSKVLSQGLIKEGFIIRKVDAIIMILLFIYVFLYYYITIAANPTILTDLFTYFYTKI